jgi:uncharacterized protein YhfF
VQGEAPPNSIEEWQFGMTDEEANSLLLLVLRGAKRATSSLYQLYLLEREELPKEGSLSIITNSDRSAACLIRNTSVEILPFQRVSAEFAAAEGEGDRSLAHWRAVHREFFTRDLLRHGLQFQESDLVVGVRFEVLGFRD